MMIDGLFGPIPVDQESTNKLDGAQKVAEDAIVDEQLKTIATKIRSKKNEGAYARAGAFLSQSVG